MSTEAHQISFKNFKSLYWFEMFTLLPPLIRSWSKEVNFYRHYVDKTLAPNKVKKRRKKGL